jgi:hypothetical protein
MTRGSLFRRGPPEPATAASNIGLRSTSARRERERSRLPVKGSRSTRQLCCQRRPSPTPAGCRTRP